MAHEIQQFDICIVCALAEEAEAVVNEFSDRCENIQFQQAFSQKNGYLYRYTMIKNSREELLTVLVICMPFTGPIETVNSVRPLLEEFHPRFVAMTGICAGYKEKVSLGDLVAASYTFHYEEGKVEADENGLDKLSPEWRTHSTAQRIVQYVNNFTTWKKPVTEMKQKMIGRELQDGEQPRCFIAPVASGMAVQGNNPFPRLLEHNRKAFFLDQEVTALYQTLNEFPEIYFLAVKGVCDYGDKSKNDDYHTFAARASAVYLLYFVCEYVTNITMPQRDGEQNHGRAGLLPVFTVPYERNLCFTGRERELQELRDALVSTNTVALIQPQALSGLGGIGKTQMAVEYAYRYRETYRCILWARAATIDTLISDFVSFADLLQLPQKNASDQENVVEAVKRWFENHADWLLILDNVDEVSLIHDFLPRYAKGHIIITTRAQAVGANFTCIGIESMGMLEGALLLLRRSKLIPVNVTLDQAAETLGSEVIDTAAAFATELGQLPLALDQAGAYIEETQCSLLHYIQQYETHRKELLARRGKSKDYPMSVTTTWSLSFQKIKEANPAAAELLNLCAFFAPDVIPEELIRKGASHWSTRLRKAADEFKLDEMIEVLLKFSLIKRQRDDQTLNIHRLVQAVLKDTMKKQTQRRWAEHVVQGVNSVFPDAHNISLWELYMFCIPQVQACCTLVEHYALVSREAITLLNTAVSFLLHQSMYDLAEQLAQKALTMSRQVLEDVRLETATCLENLALIYQDQNKHEQAELLLQQALEIRSQVQGSDLPDQILGFSRLIRINDSAKPILLQILNGYKRMLGDWPNTFAILGNLAKLYQDQNKHEQAELLYQQALEVSTRVHGKDHPDTVSCLRHLAALYEIRGKHEQAKYLLQQMSSLNVGGQEHEYLDIKRSLNSLAPLNWTQEMYDKQAKPLYEFFLSVFEFGLHRDPNAADIAQLCQILTQLEQANQDKKHSN
jgi:nucleoside phosphorylase/tetratricopeptide (TPR) repeat protein